MLVLCGYQGLHWLPVGVEWAQERRDLGGFVAARGLSWALDSGA